MPTTTYQPGESCLLGEVAKLVTDTATDSIARLIKLAYGALLPTEELLPNTQHPTPNTEPVLPNTQYPTPNTEPVLPNTQYPSPNTEPVLPNTQHPTPNTEPVLPNTQHRTPNTRIYSRPPHQTSLEYIINHALGVPGAEIEYYETTESESDRIQAAKDRESGVDYSCLLTQCEQQFVEALPMAIERLTELATGITVQRIRAGKTYTISRRPSIRAIEYIADRAAGRTGSILSALKTRFENPDTNREYTAEELNAMSGAERRILQKALEEKAANASSQNQRPSNSPPSPKIGRGAGGEGYSAGCEGYFSELPTHVTSANATLIAYLPTAIGHVKTLALGAQTIIETETERKVFDHEPDSRANAFLINRFMGRPTNFLQIERIVKKTQYEKNIDILTAKYPQVVQQYGSIQAALDAHAVLTGR